MDIQPTEPSQAPTTPVSTPASASSMPLAQAPKKSSLAWLWWLIGIIIALVVGTIVLVAVLVGSIGKGASDAANAFFDDIGSGQIQAAYDLTNDNFRSMTSFEEFNQFIASYPVVKNVKSLSFNNKKVNNDVATLRGTLTTKSGEKQTIEVIAVKKGDTWYIQSIDLNPAPVVDDSSESSDFNFDE